MQYMSEAAMSAFHKQGLQALRRSILQHWHTELRLAGDLAGPVGRSRVLDQIEEISLEDPSLSIADLTMLADLMLVEAANQSQKAASYNSETSS